MSSRLPRHDEGILTAFEERRLEALEHIASSIYGNPNTQKRLSFCPT